MHFIQPVNVNCSIWPVINKQINAVQDSIVELCSVVFRRLCDELETYMDNSDGWIVFVRRFSFADRKLYSKAGVQFFLMCLKIWRSIIFHMHQRLCKAENRKPLSVPFISLTFSHNIE